jgi:hypothetical protein
VSRFFGRVASVIHNRREANMYVSIELTTHPVAAAAFFELEREAYVVQGDELASRRTAWLERRPSEELAGLGVPTELSDPGSVRFWALPT